jgi:hypothetical protein
MAKEDKELSLRPDYEKSVVEVFTDTATALLECGHFYLLSLSQFPKNKDALPSWVPNWTSYIQRPCGAFISDEIYQSSGRSQPGISFQLLPCGCKILNIKGCVVDTIMKVGEPWLPTLYDWQDWTSSHIRCSSFFSTIAALCAESDQLGCDIYKNPSQRLEAHWRIPCTNKGRKQNLPSRPTLLGTELLEAYIILKSNDRRLDGRRHISDFRVTMGDEFKRRVFLSTQGYAGLALSHSAPGDVICILYGRVKPFILRKIGDGYELIGDA